MLVSQAWTVLSVLSASSPQILGGDEFLETRQWKSKYEKFVPGTMWRLVVLSRRDKSVIFMSPKLTKCVRACPKTLHALNSDAHKSYFITTLNKLFLVFMDLRLLYACGQIICILIFSLRLLLNPVKCFFLILTDSQKTLETARALEIRRVRGV